MQRRSIVTVFDDLRHEGLDVNLLFCDLKKLGILTSEQSEKLASLDDMERRHGALLYILLANDVPDMYHKLVECVTKMKFPMAANLQGVLVYQIICYLFTNLFGKSYYKLIITFIQCSHLQSSIDISWCIVSPQWLSEYVKLRLCCISAFLC